MRALACLLVVLAAGTAAAEDKVLVLKAEGRADKGVRAKVERAVLELAKSAGAPTAGDITYNDAAAMVGCTPDDDACRQQVVEMLSVDEIVTIATVPKPGGVEVTVRRVRKSAPTRTATAIVTPDKADQLEAIVPLFRNEPAVTTPPVTEPAPAPPVEPAPGVPPPQEVTDPVPPPAISAEQPQPRDEPAPRSRLPLFGMAGGGALFVTGLVFWASAQNIEGEIADAPKRTRDDLRKLQDLEAEGDAYATTGNVLVLAGLVVGGVSTYYFLKGRKRASRSARITPAVFGDGGGIAITWGGTP